MQDTTTHEVEGETFTIRRMTLKELLQIRKTSLEDGDVEDKNLIKVMVDCLVEPKLTVDQFLNIPQSPDPDAGRFIQAIWKAFFYQIDAVKATLEGKAISQVEKENKEFLERVRNEAVSGKKDPKIKDLEPEEGSEDDPFIE